MSTKTTTKRGRPTVSTSARQARLEARAARVAAGGEVKRGRPASTGSARQAKLAVKAAKIAAGETIKRGRPAKAEAVTALRVPKAYLGFEEVVGDGKNLSLQDIRFARTINKIQKSMIAEMNKIAIIHLFLLGFEDELQNFTLGLTNPSKQADLLMVDVWKEKVLLYKDLVTEIPNTIQPTSATWAKKHIFGFSDEDIKLDVQQIRLERAVAAELTNTPTIITHTGMFDTVDKLYKTKSGSTQTAGAAPAEGGGEPPMGGGMPPMGPEPGGGAEPPLPGGETLPENKEKNNLNILLESDDIHGDSYIDLSRARNSLGSIEDELSKLLRD